MGKKYNFGYRKSITLNAILLIIICFSFLVTLTVAFFYDSDYASNMIGMSGKVRIEAVGHGVCDCVLEGKTECEDLSHQSIEDTYTSNLIITLDPDSGLGYDVVIPGMPLRVDANCKVYKSNTSPLLRAKIEFDLISALTGETVTDSQILISELYGQMISIIEDNNWFLHTDGYFYYVGDVTQPSGAANGTLLLKEINVTATDKIIHFIDEPIRFPEKITSDYSGFAVVFKITFQGIQNYIPDEYGNRIDNTIDNSQKIFSAFTDVFNYTTDLEYFTYTTSGSDVVINPNPNMIFTPNVELPTKDPDGRIINVVGDGFRGNAQIKSIIIPNSYNKIKPNAFRSSTLTSVDMSKSSITELPEGCFQDTDLAKILFPSTITTLKRNSLYNTRLKTISLPNGLITIEDGVLFNAPLTSLYIPATVTSIGKDVFNSPYIVKIVVDEDNSSFMDNADIMILSKDGKDLVLVASILTFSSLEVPNTVEKVFSYSMYNSNAKHIYFHEKVQIIEDNVFCATYLESVEIKNTNPYLMTDEFALYNSTQTELIVMLDKDIASFTVPDSVTKIKGSAFAYCDIDVLNIGSGVSSIQSTTFDFMTTTNLVVSNINANFKDEDDLVLLNKTGTIIYKYANKNESKTSYTVPSSVKTIERYAFFNSDNLTNIVLSSGLEFIKLGAFSYCDGITEITLPSEIVTTDYQAFYGSGLLSATISGELGAEVFGNCLSLTSVIVSNTTTEIDTAIVKNCTQLSSFEFKNLTPPTIYGDLFEGVTSSFQIKVPADSLSVYRSLKVFSNYLSSIVEV